MKLYAGTTRSRADRALNFGLTKPLSVTNDLDLAWWLAEDKAETTDDQPAVIAVEVDPKDLVVHEQAWADPPQALLDALELDTPEAFHQAVQEGRIRRPRDPRAGVESLEAIRWAMHQGAVPVDRIEEVWRRWDEEEDDIIRLYAATTKSAADRALARGVNGPITLYSDIDEAINEAALKADEKGDTPVVLQVAAPKERLVVDERRWQEPPDWVLTRYQLPTVEAWHEAIAAGDILPPRDEREWRRSLAVVETARLLGGIEPSQITVAWDAGEGEE